VQLGSVPFKSMKSEKFEFLIMILSKVTSLIVLKMPPASLVLILLNSEFSIVNMSYFALTIPNTPASDVYI
jgi:hypothetical protein